MLIRFNVKNFLSFNETDEGKSIEFSMIAGKPTRKKEHIYDDGKIKLLKLATIYGANASGKSNLVKALNFTREIILGHPLESYFNKYCKINKKNEECPSYFELEIKIENSYFAYGFEAVLSKAEFISEWLVELEPTGKEKIIFQRDIKNGEFELNSEMSNDLKDRLNIYLDDIKEDHNVLFLKIMNQNKKTFYENQTNSSVNALRNVYEWVEKSLDINYPDRPISNYEYLSKTDELKKVSNIISSFGTGITDFGMKKIPLKEVMKGLSYEFQQRLKLDIINMNSLINESEKEGNNKAGFGIIIRSDQNFFIITVGDNKVICKTVQFRHKDVLFDLPEESDGTIRVLDLIEILLSEGGKTYVIDELDRCLHPSLTYHFIDSFLELAEKKDIQLIVTTHESRLLDFDLLRRDEVWFLNKKDSGESEIYSLEEYNERFDKKIDKAYLDGRYGGVPIFNTLFPINDEEL
ncbi:MAG: AAA family ATPase [Treponema sp.]